MLKNHDTRAEICSMQFILDMNDCFKVGLSVFCVIL